MEMVLTLKAKLESSNLRYTRGINPLSQEGLIVAAILAVNIDTKIDYTSGVTFDLFSDQAPEISLFFYDLHRADETKRNIYAEEIFDNGGKKQIITFPWKPL